MSTMKKCKVVMLPTNEASPIDLFRDGNKLIQNPRNIKTLNNQHLYILSDDEIKEDDWFYDKFNKKVLQANFILSEGIRLHGDNSLYKKIIATTDKSIQQSEPDGIGGSTSWFYPSLSGNFIEKYVEEYNKGNVITEILVEYWGACYNCGEYHGNSVLCMDAYSGEYDSQEEQFIPKIGKDNTITIRKAKDSWTREEVIELLNKCSTLIHENLDFCAVSNKELNEWIEENL